MKELFTELRMIIAEKLMGWALQIAPENTDGQQLRTTVYNYFKFKLDESKQNARR